MKLSMTPRRWLLTIHILFASIMFGNMVTFLILSITAVASEGSLIQSCYQVMHVLANTSVKASTIGTTLTGILLSIWTKWGLFQFYWILAKEALTILFIGLNLWGIYVWTLQALNNLDNPTFSAAQIELWIGVCVQLISLIFIVAISVFKPWGRRSNIKTK